MTDWTEEESLETGWNSGTTTTTSWGDGSGLETAWATEVPETVTTTVGYPIGLLLAITRGVSTTVTPSETSWSDESELETAWSES